MAFRILVVDDEPDVELLVRQQFRRNIRNGELDFVFARNGQEALDHLTVDGDIDIVMSDINMPVMDGLTLLTRISELDRILRTVIVSAYGDMHNIRIAMNRGAYDFLTKPIDFQDFETTLNKTIQELNAVKAGLRARQQLSAIQSELTVASRIQQSMLPRKFPPFPERKEFDLYAAMIPAREVGGDFYDFFFIDQQRLAFVIGDVSGKGVPAAIFMAVCRTLLRATAIQGMPSGECMSYINRILSKQSDVTMYVTAFYGILDTTTGDVDYCLAGHCSPYLLSATEPAFQITEPRGLVAGMFEHAKYTSGNLRLGTGDTLFLYTDGITEADDGRYQEYSERRLEEALNRVRHMGAQDIVMEVTHDVRNFAGQAPQSDDLTMLALRYLAAD